MRALTDSWWSLVQSSGECVSLARSFSRTYAPTTVRSYVTELYYYLILALSSGHRTCACTLSDSTLVKFPSPFAAALAVCRAVSLSIFLSVPLDRLSFSPLHIHSLPGIAGTKNYPYLFIRPTNAKPPIILYDTPILLPGVVRLYMEAYCTSQ